MADIEDYITSAEAAAVLGVSQGTFSKLTQNRRGDFRFVEVGRSLLWHKDDIERLRQEQEAKKREQGG